MMEANHIVIQLLVIVVLTANHKSRAEIVRRLGKPALQILAINESLDAHDGVYNGAFNGPADTEFEFTGRSIEVNKGENNVFSALMTTREKSFNANSPYGSRVLTIKSNPTKETLSVFIDLNSKSRTQTTFPINNCLIGIEKLENGNQTQYKATVKNCAVEDGFEKYFMLTLKFKPWGSSTIHSTEELKVQNIEDFKYAKTYYTSDDIDTFNTILNNPALEADGVTTTDFQFKVSYWNPSRVGDDIVANYYWKYNI